jgi:hypothetical protein
MGRRREQSFLDNLYWTTTSLGLWMFALGWTLGGLLGGGVPWGCWTVALAWTGTGCWVMRRR